MANTQSHDLSQYKAKRNFNITAEPKPKRGKVGSHVFVIQRHWATREHFDLRLEMHGVMVSWAVTRGPSTNPADKRLAVKVEDHPVSYNDFEGTIPKGQYGGGTVMIWDRGTWQSLDEDEDAALRAGKMKLEFHGQRMKGAYALVRMRGRAGETRENWLLIKERDDYATSSSNMPAEHLTSVVTGRSRDEIAGGEATKPLKKAVPDMKVAKHSAKRGPAAYVKPMLCKLVDEPPEGENWAHEEKYDGYRIQIVKHGEDVHLFSREGLDWTARFPSIAKAALKLKANAATIDGEAVVYNEQHITDFPMFVEALKESPGDIQYMAFDILNLDGEDLRGEPLSARKGMLEKVMPKKNTHLHLSAYTVGNGAKRFAESAKKKTEGIVSKRWDSRYISGRGDAWVKAKHGTREDVVVVGYVPSQRGRAFGSLVTAIESKEQLSFSGGVGTGFSVKEQGELLATLQKLERKGPTPLLRNAKLAPSGTRWVEPRMRIEVAMAGWTKDRQLRHARYLALRSVASEPRKAPVMSEKVASSKASAKVTITHGDRVMFPKAGVTKQDLADYYQKVSGLILPHLDGRPMSFVRAPESIAKETFFQRHVMPGMKSGITRVPDPEGKHADFVTVDDASGLRTIAQFGIVELHGWGSKLPNLERPDRAVFDLDPDEAVKFADVRDAALQLRAMLDDIGLVSFPMLSGGKGLHVIVPLDATQDWDTISDFTKGIARGLAESAPDRFIATASKEQRKGKIYVDWLRNKMSATAIMPWSVRARETASIAAPVTWDALPDFKSPAAFTLKNPPMKNPWRTFFTVKQNIDDKAVEFLRNRWR